MHVRSRTQARPDRPQRLTYTRGQLAVVAEAVALQGASFSAQAVSEDTGLQVDVIRYLAARAVVDRDMVGSGLVDQEDAIRIGSDAMAAAFRLQGKSFTSEPDRARNALRPQALRAMRRVPLGKGIAAEVVTAPGTICSRCATRAEVGCRHVRLIPAPAFIAQGLPTNA